MDTQYRFALKDIFLPNIIFRLNPTFRPKEGEIAIDTAIAVNYEHQGVDLSVFVKVEMADGKEVPFSFLVEGVGKFVLAEEPPPEILDSIARVNCAAMVFPYVREAVADLSRKAGFPPLHLQPVNFVSLAAEQGDAEGKKATSGRRGRRKG